MARVLVVDDDDQIRQVLRRTLTLAGHEVLEATNGIEAIQLHRTTPADLMITDIFMPARDGL